MNVSQPQLPTFENPVSEAFMGLRPFSSCLFSKSPTPDRSFVVHHLKQKLRFASERFGGIASQGLENLRGFEVGGERRKGESQNSRVCFTCIRRKSEILHEPLFFVGQPSNVLLVPSTDCSACRCFTGLRQDISAMDGKLFLQPRGRALVFDEISGGFGGESGKESQTR